MRAEGGWWDWRSENLRLGIFFGERAGGVNVVVVWCGGLGGAEIKKLRGGFKEAL